MTPDSANRHILRCLSIHTNIRCSNQGSQDIQVPTSLHNNRSKASKCMDRWILNCRNCKHNQIQLNHQLSRKTRKIRKIRKNMKMKSRKCTNKIPNLLMKFHRTKSVKRIWKYQYKSQAKRIMSQSQKRIHLLLVRKVRKQLDPILKTRIKIHLSGQKETFLTKIKESQFRLKKREIRKIHPLVKPISRKSVS